jgi:hypothetical protein
MANLQNSTNISNIISSKSNIFGKRLMYTIDKRHRAGSDSYKSEMIPSI